MSKKIRFGSLFLMLLLALGSVGMAAAVMIRSADQLLAGSLDTLKAVENAHLVVEATATVNGETMSGSVALWQSADFSADGHPALRLELLSADNPDLVGLTAVTDGSQFWLYTPARNRVVTGTADEMAAALQAEMAQQREKHGDKPFGFEGLPFAPEGMPMFEGMPFADGEWAHDGEFEYDPADWPQTSAEIVAKLLEYVTAERTGNDTLHGSSTNVLRLIPIAEKLPEQFRLVGGYFNLWLRADDQFPLALEYAKSPLGTLRIDATTAEINQPIDPARFTFDIPAGVEVVQATDLLAEMAVKAEAYAAERAAQAGQGKAEAGLMPALIPSELPADAEAAGGGEMAGATVQRFTRADGGSFFVAQGGNRPIDIPAEATESRTVVIQGSDATLYTNADGSRTLLTWPRDDGAILIGGDLTPDEAVALANALR